MCNNCIFCELQKEKNFKQNIILSSELSFGIYDIKPVTEGHALIITKKHFKNLQETDYEDLKDAIVLTKKVADKLLDIYPSIKGFNYISNQNKEANQQIFHLHIHIIPRY